MIGHFGLYFESILAVFPDLVTVMMAAAARSMAVVHVACDIALVISGFCTASLLKNLLL